MYSLLVLLLESKRAPEFYGLTNVQIHPFQAAKEATPGTSAAATQNRPWNLKQVKLKDISLYDVNKLWLKDQTGLSRSIRSSIYRGTDILCQKKGETLQSLARLQQLPLIPAPCHLFTRTIKSSRTQMTFTCRKCQDCRWQMMQNEIKWNKMN